MTLHKTNNKCLASPEAGKKGNKIKKTNNEANSPFFLCMGL
jgi:hypothetical protein